jgi:hypothetical protein
MRLLKGNRTRIFATIVGILGLVETAYPDIVHHMVEPQYQGLVLLGIGVGIFLLRQITSTPPGARE